MVDKGADGGVKSNSVSPGSRAPPSQLCPQSSQKLPPRSSLNGTLMLVGLCKVNDAMPSFTTVPEVATAHGVVQNRVVEFIHVTSSSGPRTVGNKSEG